MSDASNNSPALPANVTHDIEDITPDLARKYLEHNTSNRPIRANHVARLAKEMAEGAWVFTADPISFREGDGALMNGQHRLHAVITASVTVPMMVVRGMSEEAWSAMDRGVKRTTGDEFSRLGLTNATQTAAAVRLLKRYTDNHWNKEFIIPDHELARFYLEEHPHLMDHFSRGRAFSSEVPISPSVATVCLYLSNQADLSLAGLNIADWEEEVIYGVGAVTAHSPALQLRRQLARREKSRLKTSQRMSMGLYARAWRSWVQGREVQLLRFTDNDLMPSIEEPFKGPPRNRAK